MAALDWPTLLAGDPTQPLPDFVPDDVLYSLAYKSFDSSPRRVQPVNRAFWSANMAPDLTCIPRIIRLTAYHTINAENFAAWCRIAAAYPWLQRLDICTSNLTELPPELALLSQLYELELETTDISQLPSLLTQLPRLRALHCISSPIAFIDPALGQLPLARLLCGGSGYRPAPLTEIPEIPHLEYLGLRHMPDFSTPLTRFPKLKKLSFQGQVGKRDLPEELCDLAELTALALCEHPRTSIPDTLEYLTQLETLYLTNTSLTRLPKWIPTLEKLKSLYLFSSHDLNPDQVVATVAQMPQLSRLYLWTGFPPKSRKALQKLGFATLKSNTGVMERGTDTSAFRFLEIF